MIEAGAGHWPPENAEARLGWFIIIWVTGVSALPMRPLTPCTHPGCPHVAVAGGRCAEHKRATVRTPDGRSSAAQGYGYEWQQIRAAFLKASPQCVDCGSEERLEPHHFIAVKDGGTDDWDNLMSLCKSCHSKRTRRTTKQTR
jgi:5-methylcytosine-specific restriction protein A